MRHLSKLTILLTVLLTSSFSAALTLSEPVLQSRLGHPIEMTMELKNLGDLRSEDLLINLAPKERYTEMDVALKAFHYDLKFTAITTPDNKTQLKITSHQPVNEPYLDFIVLVRWPNGSLLKEVTVLFDAPSIQP